MQITDIRRTKRGRYSIYIDGTFYGVLHEDVYYRFRYKIGDLIEEETLLEYIEESQFIIAKGRAITLLSARFYTRKKLKEKLLKDVEEDVADAVVDRMEELGLVDDLDYAKRYASDCVNLRGFSHYRTGLALRERGISREIIEEALADLGEEDSEGLIYKQIQKKYQNKIQDEQGQRRTIAALQRRGFRYGDIRRVLDHLEEDPHYYEYDEYFED